MCISTAQARAKSAARFVLRRLTGKFPRKLGVSNLTCNQHRENKLSSANSIGSFTNFQLLVSCNGPSIPHLKLKFFYPIFAFPFSWLKLGNPLNSFLVLSTGKIWKFTLLPNLTCHQNRENKLSFANSIGSFTNFQLLVSCNGPSIPHLKLKFFYPIFAFPFSWLKLGNPLNSFLVLSTGKIWKFTLLPNLTCHQNRENKLSFANSIGSFTNFQLLVSCNGPSIPHLKMKFFYPIFGFPFSWPKLGNPLNSFLILSTGKIWKFTLLPNLTCHQNRENSTVLCQQHWQLHQLSASRLLQWPQHPTPQNEVLLPHLWVSLFMAQTWEPFEFISDFIHRKDLEVHPVTKLGMPPTQGKQHCPLPTASLGEKTEKDRCWPGTFFYFWNMWMLTWNLINFISGTSWFYFCKSFSWMTDDFSLRNMWGWTHQISFLQVGFSGLGTYDFIIFLRGPTPPGCTTRGCSCLALTCVSTAGVCQYSEKVWVGFEKFCNVFWAGMSRFRVSGSGFWMNVTVAAFKLEPSDSPSLSSCFDLSSW